MIGVGAAGLLLRCADVEAAFYNEDEYGDAVVPDVAALRVPPACLSYACLSSACLSSACLSSACLSSGVYGVVLYVCTSVCLQLRRIAQL